jgi:hypothetical protein
MTNYYEVVLANAAYISYFLCYLGKTRPNNFAPVIWGGETLN